jgi:hypothetical protein
MLAHFEVTFLKVLVARISASLVVLEPALVLLLGVVVSHVYARQNELRIVFQIGT